ncbi:hypothetical protein B9Z55_027515 [Caenorhabditis nigoni]|uniref:Uncharacterized protein n=1 Tax=Caenorhabditis nigoni TaxID=1611254 RepID=A0A2G5SGF5_9PELO|nr:hypothetical protein B9Z55_027515 [Caenorhabditis nigoni]
MEYTDLFLLSFLSKKVKKLIKSSQVNRSKKIDYIMYDCDHAQEILVYVFYKNDWNEKLLLLAKHDDTDNDCHQLSVSGKMIDIHYIDYHSFCSEPNTDPFSSHAYVVRVTDNCVASVSIQEKLIYFGVWNKTEDEFLKMIE